MRRAVKHPTSVLVNGGYRYIEGNAVNNATIKDILLAEQGNICCYTEIYLSRAVKAEIDHFNPTLKDTEEDGYHNW